MSDTTNDDLRLLYEITASDLSYFKSQQWNVSYYALLIDAGLIGVAGVITKPLMALDRTIMATLALLSAAGVLFVLRKLQRSVEVRQSRLEAVRTRLSVDFQKAWAAHYKPDEALASIQLLRIGIAITAAMTIWVVVWRL